jgi:Ca-activated chloride channel homolog
MKNRGYLLMGFILGIVMRLPAQTVDEPISKGNEFYRLSNFEGAEKQYRAATAAGMQKDIAQYNLGNALYRQRKYKEAAEAMNALAKSTTDVKIKNRAYYNEGVVYSKQKDLESSIEAYKNALRQNPDDKEARENLQKALLELKQQQQQKNNQQKQQQPSRMSQKEAERQLDKLQQKEKDIQERLNKQGRKGNAMPKDW